MIRQHRTLAQGCAVLVTAGLLATGCSSSKSSGTSGGAATTTTAAATTSSAAGGGAQPADVAGATSAVTKLYEDYYDNTKDTASKTALVQNSDKMKEVVAALQTAAAGGKSAAKVTGVTFSSATHANVLFDIYLNDAKVLAGVNGQALYDSASSTWQVADVTLCSLAKLSSVPAATLSAAGCP